MIRQFLLMLVALFFSSTVTYAHSGGVWVANDGCGHWFAIVFHYHGGGSAGSVSSGRSGLYIDFNQNGFFDVNGQQYTYNDAAGFPNSDGEFSRFTDWIDLTDKSMSAEDYINDTGIQNEVLSWLNSNKSYGKNYEITPVIYGSGSSTWQEALICPIQPLSPGIYKASTSTSSMIERPYNYSNPFDLNYSPQNFTPITPSQSIGGTTLGISSTITQTCVVEYGLVYSYSDTLPAAGNTDVTTISIWSGESTDLVSESYSHTIHSDANTEHLPYYIRSYYKQEVSGNEFYVYSSVLAATPLHPDLDFDNDGISNGIEIAGESFDTDNDGTLDYKDLDSDNDGEDDATEGGSNDCDQDGTLDFQDDTILPGQNPEDVTSCERDLNIISIEEKGGGLTFQWQVDTGSGFTDIIEDATYEHVDTRNLNIVNTPTSFSGYQYRCVVSSSDCGVSESTAAAVLTVKPAPAKPAVSNVSFFFADPPGSLSHYASGTDLTWYTAETGGTASHTAPTPSTTVVGVQEYWVTQTTEGCESERAKITVTVHPPNEINGSDTPKAAFFPLTSIVDSQIEVTGLADITDAMVYIKSGFQTGDILTHIGTLPNGITSDYNAETGTLIFKGTGNSTEWQEIFRKVVFATSSTNTDNREISFLLTDMVSLNIENKNHYYKYVSGNFNWETAKSEAEAQKLYGMPGYLATITSAEENAFITAKLKDNGWLGGTDEYQTINTALGNGIFASQTASEGNFYWVTGPEKGTAISTGNTSPVPVGSAYTHWLTGEPNDAGEGEHYLHIYATLDGGWNDFAATNGYVLEFGGYNDDFALNIEHSRTLSYNNSAGLDLSSLELDENNSINQFIAQFTPYGQEDILSLTYQLISGTGATNNSEFSISEDELKALSSFDHESNESLSIRIKVSDNYIGSFEKVFAITVKDINEVAQDIALSESIIAENMDSGSLIGSLSAIDEDDGDTHTYEFVNGGDEAHFSLDENKLKSAISFDHETKDEYSITIRTTDAGGLSFDKTYTISIEDINEVPTDITLSENTVFENKAIGLTIGSLTTTDEDSPETHTYTFVSGGDEAAFTIDGNVLKANESFDYETKDNYTLTVLVTDKGGLSHEKAFNISIKDINDIPLFGSITDQTIRVSDYPKTLTIADITPGAGHEQSQHLTFTVESSDLSILADPEIEFTNGNTSATLTYQASSQMAGGTVVITVTLSDDGGTENGGIDTYTQTFEIEVETPNGSVFIPNTFSPNGDGRNDYFRVRGENLLELNFKVFNSLGEMVYQTNDVYEATNRGWDGTIHGNTAPVGTYSWQIEGRFESGKAIMINDRNIGVVNLLK
ncbi:cadherin domain-containing protein [Rapidithrix thailandica]|uniref:Cadherin domain-containing protein n=1 Tax=Rapidithrix thailandica TaxID=413964 RepID=A0AAW9S2K9_9BACT